ncbi:unnamed protein product [Caenorhabditis sp. 36 PRJEB53466]|nr:unnamed protein product [Caenorhabditis sp. 36 PRJEB53466]
MQYRPRGILLLLLFCTFPALGYVCPTPPDGENCESNEECRTLSPTHYCLSRDGNHGVCCSKSEGYVNLVFHKQLSDNHTSIPLDLFAPKTEEELCEHSAECDDSEECMYSFKREELENNLPVTSKLKKHCYKKSAHWLSKVQLCNSDSECANNYCTIFRANLTGLRVAKKMETSKITIYAPFYAGDVTQTLHNTTLVMRDETEKVWRIETSGTELETQEKKIDCYYSFDDFGEQKLNSIRILSANVTCNGLLIKTVDIEIQGFKVSEHEKQFTAVKGICGHPGLTCPNCFIDGKLYKCAQDEDCWAVGDSNWVVRNEKSQCSWATLNGHRLCKRDAHICPFDSLNSNRSQVPEKACKTDDDCENMANFTVLRTGEVEFYPHCYHGVCCARRAMCNPQENTFPYSFPVEKYGRQEACHVDADCTMFPNLVGTCHFSDAMWYVLKLRKRKYLRKLQRLLVTSKKYGMCCYSKKDRECPMGGTPTHRHRIHAECETHADCNINLPVHEWTAHCNRGFKKRTCCEEKKSEAMCPNGYTPYRTEPKCTNVSASSDYSGNCPKENGMCYKGHCCPKLTIEKSAKMTPFHSDYVTETPCDPLVPLDFAYRFAYCDENVLRVVVMGDRSWDGNELEWQRKRCRISRDCTSHPFSVCVHKIYNLRYCVLPPTYRYESNQHLFSDMTTVSITLFFVIIIGFFFYPTRVLA